MFAGIFKGFNGSKGNLFGEYRNADGNVYRKVIWRSEKNPVCGKFP
jgi:hypothetical protein